MTSRDVDAPQGADLSVLDRGNIRKQTYQRLCSMILEQELGPGTNVTERRLAEAISISRPPLRTALNRLNGAGGVMQGIDWQSR